MADPTLVNALASSTAILTNNKGAVLGWFATIFGFVILVVIVIGLLSRARRSISNAITGYRAKHDEDYQEWLEDSEENRRSWE